MTLASGSRDTPKPCPSCCEAAGTVAAAGEARSRRLATSVWPWAAACRGNVAADEKAGPKPFSRPSRADQISSLFSTTLTSAFRVWGLRVSGFSVYKFRV